MVPALNANKDGFVAAVGTYKEHVQEMRDIIVRVLMKCGYGHQQAMAECLWYTAHSAKPTLISIATLAQENPTAIRLQGGWRSPEGATPMQFEYSRESMAVPLEMTTRLLRAVRLGEVDVAKMVAVDVLSAGPATSQRPQHCAVVVSRRPQSSIEIMQPPVAESLGSASETESSGSECDIPSFDFTIRTDQTDWIRTKTKIHAAGEPGSTGCGLSLGATHGILFYEVVSPSEQERKSCMESLRCGEFSEYCKRGGCFIDK